MGRHSPLYPFSVLLWQTLRAQDGTRLLSACSVHSSQGVGRAVLLLEHEEECVSCWFGLWSQFPVVWGQRPPSCWHSPGPWLDGLPSSLSSKPSVAGSVLLVHLWLTPRDTWEGWAAWVTQHHLPSEVLHLSHTCRAPLPPGHVFTGYLWGRQYSADHTWQSELWFYEERMHLITFPTQSIL